MIYWVSQIIIILNGTGVTSKLYLLMILMIRNILLLSNEKSIIERICWVKPQAYATCLKKSPSQLHWSQIAY